MSYDSVILGTTGLVSYWPLNESSGTVATDNESTNNGTYTGTAGTNYTLSQGGIGDGETSVLFDGSAGYVDVPLASALQPASVSVEAWVYASSATLGTCAIVCSNKFTSKVGYELGFDISGATASGVASTLQFGSYNGSWHIMSDPGGAGGLSASHWHYIVGTYDGSNLRLYIDGSQVGTATAFAGPLAYDTGAGSDLYISKLHSTAGATFFAGRVAKVAVYNVALNSTTIGQHFSAAGSTPARQQMLSMLGVGS